MKAPVSWIREYVDLPDSVGVEELTDRLTMLGLKLEALITPADAITGPLVVGRVLSVEKEPQKNGKVINWCAVDVGAELNAVHNDGHVPEGVGIICGAHNFVAGDLVVCCLPGAVLPGDFAISARKTYGHVSSGMICSARELGLGDDHDGIIVLPAGSAEPGTSAFEVLGMDDPVIEFEINPDRAYALSLRGIAREAAIGFDAPFRDPAVRDLPEVDGAGPEVVVHDPAGCPVFAARTVSGIDPAAATPEWMATRLQQAGMRPISVAVDITNYVMLELGQPIHGYDADKVAGALQVRRAQAGEKLTTLDGAQRTLYADDLVIVDDSGPIGLAGVMGGATTEMSETTTRVLIEAANWEPASMFRTGRRHKLTSEAGKRNERGVDPTLPLAAVERVAELLVAHGGGTVEPGVTLVGEAPEPPVITIPGDLPARITGMEIDVETTVADLELVGCTVTREGDTVSARVPTWRPDLTDPYDLVEEVARIVGYDKIPSVLPPAPAGRGLTSVQRFRRRVGLVLAGAGLTETIGYPFVGEGDWAKLGLAADDERRRALRIENPLNNEEPLLTTTLLPGLLEAAARNVGRGNSDLGLFETGLVFLPKGDEKAPILGVDRRPSDAEWQQILDAVPHQPQHLGLVLVGQRERSGWWGEGRAASWADALESVRRVAAALGVELTSQRAALAPWHPGRCAELRVGETVIGHAGELHPKVCEAHGLPPRSAAAEIDLDLLFAEANAPQGQSFSSYPVAKEDVALVVADDVSAAEVESVLREGAGELLESIRLFDVFTGVQVGEGKKSLAFALRFRAGDRTLKEGESVAARDAAVALAAERLGAVQRA